MAGTNLKVIDVSRWQGFINWARVKGNIDAAIIKVGGSDVGFYMDGYAQRNLMEARSNKIPIGTYYFLGGVHTPSEEVQHIINLFNQLGGLKTGEPFFLDWERRRAGHDEVGYLTAIVEGLSKRGFPAPGVYMNNNYVLTNNWQPLVNRNCPLWVARWGDNDTNPEPNELPNTDEWKYWLLWQYSSTGSIPGIAGRVDLNLLSGDLNTFRAYGLKGNQTFPGEPAPIPQPMPPQSAYQDYVIKPGDSLSKIASFYKKTWQQLFAMNRDKISNPDRIYPGQRIRVWKTPVGSPLNNQANNGKWHTVANGENLSVIANRYNLSSWQSLYDYNKAIIGDNPHLIKPGQRIKIP